MLQARSTQRLIFFRELSLLCALAILQIDILLCEAFQNQIWAHNRNPSIHQNIGHKVIAEPLKGAGSSEWRGRPRKKKRILRTKRKNQKDRREEVFSSGRWDKAVLVETQLQNALDALLQSLKLYEASGAVLESYPLQFPGIRDCNAALASFGDTDDLLRALRLYFKMRKVAALSKKSLPKQWEPVPTPTLVTFSTLMSRAMYAGKPMVAIRIWNMMRQEPNFFTSKSSLPHSTVRPHISPELLQ